MTVRAFLRRQLHVMRGWEMLAVPSMELGECPRWSPDGRTLWWVDIPQGVLFRHDLTDRSTSSWKLGTEVAALALDAHGQPWLVVDGSLHTVDEEGKLARQPIEVPVQDTKRCRANDAAFAPTGDLWITTMDRAGHEALGAILSFSPRRGFSVIANGLTIGNGPAFDAARGVAYIADSPNRTIFRIALEESATLRPFVQFAPNEGFPDGMATDAEGRLWVAHYGAGKVSVWSTTGERLETISTPCACPTALALKTEDNELTVAVTSAHQHGEPRAIWLKHYGTGTPFIEAHANTPPR